MSERSRARRARSTGRAAIAALGALLLVAGCGGSGSPLPAEEAVAHYEDVSADLLGALDAVRPLTWEHRAQEILEPGAEDCRYQAGIWEADAALYPEPGQGMDWEPWRTAVDPVLEEHGFEALGREQSSGGEYWLESEGPHGARIVLESRGSLRITDVRVDAEPCEDAALGL